MDMNILEKENLFWSRLGFEVDPPICGEDGKLISAGYDYEHFASLHKKMFDCGIKVHTSILHSGWVGPDRYDYTFTDHALKALFDAVPDALYIPRIKLNAPMDWMKENLGELFVYYEGPETPEEIRKAVDTPLHDILGADMEDGYAIGNIKRRNVGGVISNQSFCSEKWLEDAGRALRKLMRRIAESPYADRVIGYHIGYGPCGETVLWGRCAKKKGDYSVPAKRRFAEFSKKRTGKALEIPPPSERESVVSSVKGFLRERPGDDAASSLYDEFMSEVNVKDIEYFAGIVKEESQRKALCGVFYGYMIECHNAAYAGHMAFERLLNSPDVDFWAAPMSYYRRGAGEPGGYLGPAQSVNRRKLWVDELDIRTHCKPDLGFEQARNMKETRTVLWREFSKNLASGSSFWWMDLGGGWLDDPEIYREIGMIQEKWKSLKEKPAKSVAEVLVVTDNISLMHVSCNGRLHRYMLQETLRELQLAGAPVDTYRLCDLASLNAGQYKLVLFLSCYDLQADTKEVLSRFENAYFLNFYLNWRGAAEFLGTSLKETGKLCDGGTLRFTELSPWKGEMDMPVIPVPEVVPVDGEVWAEPQDGSPFIVRSGKRIYSALPVLRYPQFRALGEYAGVRFYADVPCTVYADSRFTACFPQKEPECFSFRA